MPLYKTIHTIPNVKVLIWKIDETEEGLSKNIVLNPRSQKRMENMKSSMHRSGFLSIRHLLAFEGYTDNDLFYDGFGKPHLKNKTNISITHSHNFTGIILSKNDEVGIDIEMQRDKILRIANKFTPIEEYRTLANTDAIIRKLTIVWGAKESLYKIYAHPGLSFLHHINVNDFRLDDSQTTAEILFHGTVSNYEVFFLEFEGFTCVYAIKNKHN